VKKIEIETLKATEKGEAVCGIKLCVMKEYNILWLNRNTLDYYLATQSEATKEEGDKLLSMARELMMRMLKKISDYCLCVVLCADCECCCATSYSEFF